MKHDSGHPPDVDPIARLLEQAGPRPAAPGEREARVQKTVRAHWRAEVDVASRRRRLAWAAVSLAAAAAVAVVIGRGWWSQGIRPPGPEESIATLLRAEGSVHLADGGLLKSGDTLAPGGEIETGPDGRAALSLSDGSSLRLDTGTRVRLAAGPVLVLDRGSVYIDSGTGQPRRAFLEVRTRMGVVRDIGTQFEVRLREDELWVSVREGLATLARAGRSFAAPAGTRLVAGAAGGVESRALPVLGPEWDWVLAIAPEFRIEGRTLGEYLDWLSRETGWRVQFADPSIARNAPTIILHGSVAGLRPDETPPAVLPTCGLRHRLSDSTLVIERQDSAGRP